MAEEELQVLVEVLAPIFQKTDMVLFIENDALWETLGNLIDPEAEMRFVAPEGGAMGTLAGPFRGVDGIRAGWREWLGPWQTWVVEPQKVLEAGGGRVVSLVRARGRMRESSAEITQEAAAVLRVDSGRLVAIDYYLDQAQARRDAGLD